MKNFAKKFAAAIGGAAFLVSSMSFAAIAPEEIAIHNIKPGMTANEVIAAVGQPFSRSKNNEHWHYDGFDIEFDDDRSGFVEEIEAYNGIVSTPAGVRVGQGAEVLSTAYGTADKVDAGKHDVEYEYYSTDRSKKIEFKVSNGVIVKITCKMRD